MDTIKKQVSVKNTSIASLLWAIIAGSLTIHIIIMVADHTVLSDWRWIGSSVHTALEVSGTVTALMVAIFLLRYERFKRGTHFNVQIAAALISMGILDGFHALVVTGNTFVWLHSIATFFGGLLFAFVFLPSKSFNVYCWPSIAFIGSMAIGFLSLLHPEFIPKMIEGSEFTTLAVTLNVVGGILLFMSAIKLIFTYRHHKNTDDLLFCLHCSLFGAAAIMFQQSSLWDVSWWGWHILRFLAYLVAAWFVIRGEEEILNELEEHRHHLTKLLAEQTIKYQQSENAQRIAHLGSWRQDIKSGKAEWSDELYRIFGFEPKSMPPTLETFRMVLHNDDKNRCHNEYSKAIMQSYSMKRQCQIIRPNGQLRYLHISVTITHDKNNQPLETIGIAFDITEQKEKEAQIEYLANYDVLTDLPSLRLGRERMSAELAYAKRNRNGFAVMFIDLDGFKQVNDTFGHEIGDTLLKKVAERLTSCLRDCDMVARIGGDEFLVLQTDVGEVAGVTSVARKLIVSIANPYNIEQQVIQIGASIGISIFPEHGDTTHLLIKKADQAMYKAKKNGKNCFRFAS